jgi:hypothetical protein
MFEELSSKIKILIGLGVSGLLSLIGYGFRNLVILQNQWLFTEGTYHPIPVEADSFIRGSAEWLWLGKKSIYPLQDTGSILFVVGVVIFIVDLIYVNYLTIKLYKLSRGSKK